MRTVTVPAIAASSSQVEAPAGRWAGGWLAGVRRHQPTSHPATTAAPSRVQAYCAQLAPVSGPCCAVSQATC